MLDYAWLGEKMGKLLSFLFSVLVLVGCATKDENTSFYAIDPVATANAPWAIGEVAIYSDECNIVAGCYTIFLGATKDDGFNLIQDYYNSGKKLSDPYWVEVLVYPLNERFAVATCNRMQRFYYENGGKWLEMVYENEALAAFSAWDENGNLITETDFGFPEN